MLEKYFPNIYGWLVWGGGLRAIVLFFRTLIISTIVFSCLYAAYYLGGLK